MFARLTPAQDCPAADEAFLAVIGFDRGLTAVIDVNRASPATVFRGWTITGDAGSYADFTQYTPTPEGEIVDVPQPSHAALPDEIYGNLVRNIRLNEPAVASATEARQVLVLVAAARNSAAGGGPVPIEF
jgi:predicted dehydrogenase